MTITMYIIQAVGVTISFAVLLYIVWKGEQG
ncbi:hypothetical protein LCGC14_1306370 [marine sediment metagenome]|uniref:Uncharacterized protein n=1 Tax=marine sediment metagenome TaxID=412755 RepID=A0A0F9NR43_9ZZZZ